MRLPIPLAVVLALMTAGCTSGGDDGGASDVPTAPSDPGGVGSSDTGSVEGLVTDDEARAVGGAQAGLIELGLLQSSDENGQFVIPDVPSGTHTLAVQKLGYESIAVQVTVRAEETTQVSVELVPLRAAAPFVQLDSYTGHLDWGVRVEPAVGGVASGDIVHRFTTEDRTDLLENIYIEMVWEDTQALAGGMRLRVEITGEDNVLDYTFCVLDGVSPLTCLVEKGTVEDILGRDHSQCEPEECKLQWRGFTATHNTNQPVDFGVMVDQDFTVYTSLFYYEPMPAGYSALPDA